MDLFMLPFTMDCVILSFCLLAVLELELELELLQLLVTDEEGFLVSVFLLLQAW